MLLVLAAMAAQVGHLRLIPYQLMVDLEKMADLEEAEGQKPQIKLKMYLPAEMEGLTVLAEKKEMVAIVTI